MYTYTFLYIGTVRDGAHGGAGGMMNCNEVAVSHKGGKTFQGGNKRQEAT